VAFPRRLSETGIFADAAKLAPAAACSPMKSTSAAGTTARCRSIIWPCRGTASCSCGRKRGTCRIGRAAQTLTVGERRLETRPAGETTKRLRRLHLRLERGANRCGAGGQDRRGFVLATAAVAGAESARSA
jgi:hypothetical protein